MKYSAFDWCIWGVYTNTVIYLFVLAFGVVSLIGLVNDITSGNPEKPNSESVSVLSICVLLSSITQFILAKYLAAISDFVGRKPVIILSILVQALSCFMLSTATTVGEVIVAVIVRGAIDVNTPVSHAWLCDMVRNSERSAAFSLIQGLGAGVGFTLGIPLGAVASSKNIRLPFIIGGLMLLADAVIVLVLPLNDTVFVRSGDVTGATEDIFSGDDGEKNAAVMSPLARVHDSAKQVAEKKAESGGGQPRLHSAERPRTVRLSSFENSKAMDVVVDSNSVDPSCCNTCGLGFLVQGRRLPSNWCEFLWEHQPLSGFSLIRKAERPSDWLSQFLWWGGLSIINGIFINYS